MALYEIVKPYDVRRRVAIEFDPDEGMTEQHHKDQCDVNTIMAKYIKTGLIDHVQQYAGEYMDLASDPDFHTSMNKVKAAEAMFLTVPAAVRAVFDNDPGKFLEFVTDPDNIDEIREMGLAPQPEAVPPVGAGAEQPPVAGEAAAPSPKGEKKPASKPATPPEGEKA